MVEIVVLARPKLEVRVSPGASCRITVKLCFKARVAALAVLQNERFVVFALGNFTNNRVALWFGNTYRTALSRRSNLGLPGVTNWIEAKCA